MVEKFDPAPVDIHAENPREAIKANRKVHDDLKAGLIGSFPASDPPSVTQPPPSKHDSDRSSASGFWKSLLSIFKS